MSEEIDIVILWVDGNDMDWRREKAKYSVRYEKQDAGESRYRNWENLQYLFRGIEKYAPWVRKIHFVTWGHVPIWLNIKHNKINIVRHEDFIPKEYLPTFNCNPILLNLHRIEGLSERFILFNDDFFLGRAVKETDFFKNGLPCDQYMEYPIGCGGNNEVFSHILVNNFNMIGKYFSKMEFKKKLVKKILNPIYGVYFFYNLFFYFMPFPNFYGLLTPHFCQPYLKSDFEKLWKLEAERLNEVCFHKFRDKDDLTEYAVRTYNVLSGNFAPYGKLKQGKAVFIRKDDPIIYKTIESNRYKFFCLNDDCDEEVFRIVKPKIQKSFERKFIEKSSFEL